jgi:hypothetical protein
MDDVLHALPRKKAKLEETRRLLDRLTSKKGTIDSGRYDRLAARYRETIPELEDEVKRLTEQGEDRKVELEDRLEHQRARQQEADEELDEIEELYEDGVLDRDAYRKDRRRFRSQKKEAEREIRDLEAELEELQFYLTEVGYVQPEKSTGRQVAKAVGEQADGVLAWGQSLFWKATEAFERPQVDIAHLWPSARTVYSLLSLAVALFLLNWGVGMYVAGKVKPILDARLSQWRPAVEVVTYESISANPIFRSVTIHGFRMEDGGSVDEGIQVREGTFGASVGMLWHLVTEGEPESLESASLSLEDVNFGSGKIQFETLSAEFDGRLDRRMLEKFDPDHLGPLVKRPQALSVSVTGTRVKGDFSEINFAPGSTVRKALETQEASIEINSNPNTNTIEFASVVEDAEMYLDASVKLMYSLGRGGNADLKKIQVQGEWSWDNFTYRMPTGARYSVESAQVWTNTPLTLRFPTDLYLPEGSGELKIKNTVATGELIPPIRGDLRYLGIGTSVLRTPTDIDLKYELENRQLRLGGTAIRFGNGTYTVKEGSVSFRDIRDNRVEFRGFTVRLSGFSSATLRTVQKNLEGTSRQPIPRRDDGLTFRMDGSIDDPEIRPPM